MISLDARAKRLLVMASQEGNSAAALRLGDYAFYGYGKDKSVSASAAEKADVVGEEELGGGLVVHHGIRCDESGMFPILGNRWHKIGEDFDLCEMEYQKLTDYDKPKFSLVEVVSVEEGVDYTTSMTHYRVAAGQGVAQAAFSLGYMYEWGHGAPVDEPMAEHFYRQAISLAEKHGGVAPGAGEQAAQPATLYFTAALLKLHTRQRLRESWATVEGVRGRLEEQWAAWSPSIAEVLEQQGLLQFGSTNDWEVQLAVALAAVLVVAVLWRACFGSGSGGAAGEAAGAAEARERKREREQPPMVPSGAMPAAAAERTAEPARSFNPPGDESGRQRRTSTSSGAAAGAAGELAAGQAPVAVVGLRNEERAAVLGCPLPPPTAVPTAAGPVVVAPTSGDRDARLQAALRWQQSLSQDAASAGLAPEPEPEPRFYPQ